MPAMQLNRTLPEGMTMPKGYYYVTAIAASFYEGPHGTGSLTVNGHPSIEKWTSKPAEQVQVVLGGRFSDGTTFPTLAALMQDPRFIQAVGLINDVLVDNLIEYHPIFKDATKLP